MAMGGESLNTVEMFNPMKNTWSMLAPMSTKRCYHAVGISGDKNNVVVAGGRNDTSGAVLSSAEWYNFNANKWDALPNISTYRTSTGGVFLADGTTFLVTGGYNGSRILSSCEQLNITTRTWSFAASLSISRGFHCTVLYNGKPVVLGGLNVSSYALDSCEQYTPTTNAWTGFPALKMVRYWGGATVIQSRIYITGGNTVPSSDRKSVV